MARDIVCDIRNLRGCWLITLASGDAFRVPGPLMRLHPLRIGEQMEAEEYLLVLEQDAYPLAMDRAARLLSQRDYSVSMLARKLQDAGYSAATALRVTDYLTAQHYLDDGRYAAGLLRRKQGKLGARRIADEMRARGLDGALAQRTLSSLSGEDQLQAATVLARKYLGRKRLEPGESRQATIAYLVRRGYSFEIARRACQTVSEDGEE